MPRPALELGEVCGQFGLLRRLGFHLAQALLVHDLDERGVLPLPRLFQQRFLLRCERRDEFPRQGVLSSRPRVETDSEPILSGRPWLDSANRPWLRQIRHSREVVDLGLADVRRVDGVEKTLWQHVACSSEHMFRTADELLVAAISLEHEALTSTGHRVGGVVLPQELGRVREDRNLFPRLSFSGHVDDGTFHLLVWHIGRDDLDAFVTILCREAGVYVREGSLLLRLRGVVERRGLPRRSGRVGHTDRVPLRPSARRHATLVRARCHRCRAVVHALLCRGSVDRGAR
mmetsp:Transcript_9680/g.22873  ORF Transcript_9680/g.22873 Transcript_9680/m.22873 type:complete len:288 (-) Transcript_9680:338-1201(-)